MVAGNPNVDLMQRLEVAVVGVEIRDRDRQREVALIGSSRTTSLEFLRPTDCWIA
jgi:hypothetical protein